jgi:hypothetical protein
VFCRSPGGNFKLEEEEVMGKPSSSSSFEPQDVLVFENRVYSYVGKHFMLEEEQFRVAECFFVE